MNTVIIVNLNGIAFHLEEPGFLTLRTYLERAQAQLAANPDKTEIMSDLEQAIADKCSHFLSPHKNVLTAAEIDDVVSKWTGVPLRLVLEKAGDIRAFDVHTGALRWAFHTIPHPGEAGYATWPQDAWKSTGAANNGPPTRRTKL